MQGEPTIPHDINFIYELETANVKNREQMIMFSTFSLSKHAILRMAQRNVSLADLEYVLEHGERIHITGITVYILRRRDIPQQDRNKSAITRLEGTAVLTGFTPTGELEVITAYRNKSAVKALRAKAKYDCRKKHQTDGDLRPER